MILCMGIWGWVTTSWTVGALSLAFWIMAPVDQRRYEFVYDMIVISPMAQPWYVMLFRSRSRLSQNK
jgi:hypothetical protein